MSTIANLYYESSLSHHGILGQKWGVRRYQNPDGSLTAKGRKHQQKQMEKIVRKERTEQQKLAVENLRIQEQRKTAQAKAKLEEEKRLLEMERSGNTVKSDSSSNSITKKNVKDLSDQEIRDFLNRVDLEKKYLAIVNPPKQENAVSKFIKDTGSDLLKNVLKDVAKTQLNNAFDSLLKSSDAKKKEQKANKVMEDNAVKKAKAEEEKRQKEHDAIRRRVAMRAEAARKAMHPRD